MINQFVLMRKNKKIQELLETSDKRITTVCSQNPSEIRIQCMICFVVFISLQLIQDNELTSKCLKESIEHGLH